MIQPVLGDDDATVQMTPAFDGDPPLEAGEIADLNLALLFHFADERRRHGREHVCGERRRLGRRVLQQIYRDRRGPLARNVGQHEAPGVHSRRRQPAPGAPLFRLAGELKLDPQSGRRKLGPLLGRRFRRGGRF
ncbi:MAG: hypothetical protein QM775_36855 [Pirellulales bacterium]